LLKQSRYVLYFETRPTTFFNRATDKQFEAQPGEAGSKAPFST